LISFDEALKSTLDHIQPLGSEPSGLESLAGRVAAKEVLAKVYSPSIDASLKDGYAVHSSDIVHATPDAPVPLRLLGRAAAGEGWEGEVLPGTAVRILSGAPIPEGATSVVAEEFTRREGDTILIWADSHEGRNILQRGSDVCKGQRLLDAGEVLQPERIGLLAAAGVDHVEVRKRPHVGVVATGDEVIAPGRTPHDGQLFASNLVALAAWCRRFGMRVETQVAKDDAHAIAAALQVALRGNDALLTSGGAWKGDRDLVVHVLDQLGWTKVYHRVKIGPGKAVGFGMLGRKPVFCLPGGPPSNQMAFLQLALPGLLALSGRRVPELPRLPAQLSKEVHGQVDWTQFIYGRLERTEDFMIFHPLKMPSRLQMMAHADAILCIPEGVETIPAGAAVCVQTLL